jgi:hypothetical protein
VPYLKAGPSKHFVAQEGVLGRGKFEIHFADAARFGG